MKKRFKSKEEEVEAIRRSPAFRALVDELKSQSPEQLERFEEWFGERTEVDRDGLEEGRETESND